MPGFNRNKGRPRPTMHKATCSNCGRECQVPFLPTSGKPIFCSDCFEKNGGSENRRPDDRRSDDRRGDNRRSDSRSYGSGSRSFEQKEMFDAVCDDCGRDCKVPFQPRSGKPIYCSNCFEKHQDSEERRPQRSFDREPRMDHRPAPPAGVSKQQYEELNAKLDKILELLSPLTPEEDEAEPDAV